MEQLQSLYLVVIWLVTKLQTVLMRSFRDEIDDRQRPDSHATPQAPLPNNLTQNTSVKTYLQRHEKRHDISTSTEYCSRWQYLFAPHDVFPAFYGYSMYTLSDKVAYHYQHVIDD